MAEHRLSAMIASWTRQERQERRAAWQKTRKSLLLGLGIALYAVATVWFLGLAVASYWIWGAVMAALAVEFVYLKKMDAAIGLLLLNFIGFALMRYR